MYGQIGGATYNQAGGATYNQFGEATVRKSPFICTILLLSTLLVFGLFPLYQSSIWLTYCYWDFSLSHAYVTFDNLFDDNVKKIDGSLSDLVDNCNQFEAFCPGFCDNSKKIRSAGDTSLAFGWISVLLAFLGGVLIIFVWIKKGVSARILRFFFFVPSILFTLAGILYIGVSGFPGYKSTKKDGSQDIFDHGPKNASVGGCLFCTFIASVICGLTGLLVMTKLRLAFEGNVIIV